VNRRLSAPSSVKVCLALALLVALILSACAAPPAGPTDSTGAAAADPQATAPASAVTVAPVPPTLAPAAVITATEASAPAATATVAGVQAAAGGSGTLHLVLVPDGSQARFKVREQLAGRNLPNDAVGTTNAVSGKIDIGANGVLVPDASKITVDMTSLKTDESRRDNFIKRNTLDTAQYPAAVFVPTAVKGLPSPLPSGGDVKFELTGDLTLHGVTKPITWQATGKIAGQDLTGTASTRTTFEQFGMTPPRAAVVLSVEDNITLEIDFHLTRQ
jgi:polyisoprenoid-binding protein YceI